MYKSLSIKWRPKYFSDVKGQDNIINYINNGFLLSKLHNAYILAGSHGIGKTTIARLISKGLNCNNRFKFSSIKNLFPCGKCINCKLIEENKFLDFIEIDAASKTKVEDIRDLLENLNYPSVYGNNKIYLIDEVHMLSKQSFGTLLKSLEEPPLNTTFILATTEFNKIPDTVISRCLCFLLNKISSKNIVERLKHILKHEEVINDINALWIIANKSKGSMRDALNLVDKIITMYNIINIENVNKVLNNNINVIINLFKVLSDNEIDKIYFEINNIFKLEIDYEILIDNIISLVHYIYMFNFYKDYILEYEFNEFKDEIIYLSKNMSLKDNRFFYNTFLNVKKYLCYYPTTRIGFEIGILNLLNNNIIR